MTVNRKHRTLEQRTLAYWNLSLGWHGKQKPKTMEKALKETCDIVCTTDPHKPLTARVRRLEHEMIVGKPSKGRSKRVQNTPNTLTGQKANLVIIDEAVNLKPE